MFLLRANKGININLLTMRRPTNLLITDACLDGIGGISMTTGRSWRLDLRRFCIKDNKKLEFLAAVVGILQAFYDHEIPHLGNVLCLTDDSSALCWLHRNNFHADLQPIHVEIAKKLALMCIENDFTIHSQHIAGVENQIADCLSRSIYLLMLFTTASFLPFPTRLPGTSKYAIFIQKSPLGYTQPYLLGYHY